MLQKNLKLFVFMENWGNKVACLFILNMPSEFLFCVGKQIFSTRFYDGILEKLEAMMGNYCNMTCKRNEGRSFSPIVSASVFIGLVFDKLYMFIV